MARSEVKRPWRLWLVLALTTAVALAYICIHRRDTTLTLTHYEVAAEVSAPLRIVHLSDLHSREYGQDNETLITMVREQEPDLIFLTGDMLNRKGTAEDIPPLCDLITRLAQIAPVYWSDGNHEKTFVSSTGTELHPYLTGAGATVLDCGYADVEVRGQKLRLGGYYGYYGTPHMTADDPVAIAAEERFFADFEDTERLKLLLCHIPTSWVDWGYINTRPVALVFSGHYHGGQIRLPFIGGLYAPYVGFFPEYTRGVFAGEQGVCVLSAGMGSEPGIPRVNNPPEILVVDLIPK